MNINVAVRLGLKGSSKRLAITNALLKTSELDSKLVNLDISSVSHPNKTKKKTL